MGNFEMRYPVHGSAALKPSSAKKSQSATIIEFPAIAQNEFDWESLEQNSAAAQPSDFSQLKALFTTPLDDRQMVRSLSQRYEAVTRNRMRCRNDNRFVYPVLPVNNLLMVSASSIVRTS